ncbi:MAG: SH3 domain-containing protein [Prevotella sp.]|jgi:hypothetical protein|nr:SH3 domain-containing protein [Prevotella sp.]
MLRNKGILFFICFSLINTFVYTQEIVRLKVTDTGVRLRETPGVTGKIIRNLDLHEIVEYIESKYTEYTDEYKWVNIKTNRGIGWAYGEYFDFIQETQNNQFDFIENIKIRTTNGFIFPGLTKEKTIEVLGEPIKTWDGGHEYCLYYGNNEDLRIDFYKYNNRINHIIIKSAHYILANGARVGLNIKDFSNNKNHLRNIFRNEIYDAFCGLLTEKDGTLYEIQIGYPDP